MVGCSSRGISRMSAEERPGKLKCVGTVGVMWVVCRLSVFCEPFTDRAFGFPYILFFTFFTFNHICKVSRITGYMLFYLSCFAGVAKSVRSSCIVNVRASETSMSGVAAESARDELGCRVSVL